MGNYIVEESKSVYGAKMKVVAIGGGGGNMLNHMAREGMKGIDLIAANTDAQALDNSLAHTKIQLGEKTTRGLGAGMVPAVGKEAAEESYEEIKSSLEHSDIVFIASGFGGGTGTGAAPVIAQAAKEVNALTVSVITRPFRFEGPKRAKLAEAGLEELRKYSDSIIVIPNDKLLSLVDKKLGIKEAFKVVDDVLYRAVSGMSYVVLSSGNSDINMDFADVKTVMGHRGMALMGVGESSGEEAAMEAVKNAIESPLLDNITINGAMGVLVHFHIHPDCPLLEISEAMEVVYDAADEDAHIIFGTTTDESMTDNTVRVTIIATGFDSKKEEKKETKTLDQTNPIPPQDTVLKVVNGYPYEVGDSDLDTPAIDRFRRD
ncbi:MAG: cell division protein FtsZ [Campylobacteraceae bacterium]|nr:cell division protein FtsZ [Campylobacteraceae bacterium]